MASKVFDITELLEAIMLNLPMRDLLLAQRISKTFKLTIDDSIKCQQALFLAPLPVNNKAEPRLNLLLCYRTIYPTRFFMALDPESLPPHASAFRMLLLQPPELAELWALGSQRAERGIIQSFPPFSRPQDDPNWDDAYPFNMADHWFHLEYRGETLSEYFSRVHCPLKGEPEGGVVWERGGPGQVSAWIGDWDQVSWTLV